MFFTDAPTLDLLTRSLVLGPVTVLAVIVLVNIVGLRSFSKMAAFDFVITVATGSLLANAAVASKWPAFIQSNLAILAILAIQVLLAWMRRKSDGFEDVLSNEPLILFSAGAFDEEAMSRSRVSKSDVWAKMREANALNIDAVRAVVLETTGDIAVLHGEHVDDEILTGIANRADHNVG